MTFMTIHAAGCASTRGEFCNCVTAVADTEPKPQAALLECREYFDQRADAESFSDGTVTANEEMRLLTEIDAALDVPLTPPVTAYRERYRQELIGRWDAPTIPNAVERKDIATVAAWDIETYKLIDPRL